MLQQREFIKELRIIKNAHKQNSSNDDQSTVTNASPIYGLEPFLDDNGVLRVGGQLRNSSLNRNLMHPILLPRRSVITSRIIEWCHNRSGHSGRNMTLNEIRCNCFWIINGDTAVRSHIYHCVTYRKLRYKLGEQKMADLPAERSSNTTPFIYVGMDMFGPFVTKEGRKELKCYGAIFQCLASWAIHLEVINSVDTDTFIMCLRTFIGRCGNVRMLRYDNGINFIGAEKKLSKGFLEMNQNKIRIFLQNSDSDWLIWKKNPPAGSHFGGIRERQIRSARAVLGSLLRTHGPLLFPLICSR